MDVLKCFWSFVAYTVFVGTQLTSTNHHVATKVLTLKEEALHIPCE